MTLRDLRTGQRYLQLESIPDFVLEFNQRQILHNLQHGTLSVSTDDALDCYNAWKEELARRRDRVFLCAAVNA